MGQLFHSIDGLYSFIEAEHKKRPSRKIDIVTFNLYAGFSKGRDWDSLYPSQVRSLINNLQKAPLRIVVGIPTFVPCKEGCEECRALHKNRLDSFESTKRALSLNIRFIKNCHMKMYRVGDVYIIGGMNLTGSRSLDVAVTVEDRAITKQLQAKFEVIWESAQEEPF